MTAATASEPPAHGPLKVRILHAGVRVRHGSRQAIVDDVVREIAMPKATGKAGAGSR